MTLTLHDSVSALYGADPRRVCRWLALSFVLLSTSVTTLQAQLPTANTASQEARARFDRAVHLFNQGNNGFALAEFLRAYELAPHPVVLLNIGLVHAVMGDPIAARETFNKLLADPSGLTDKQIVLAQRRHAEQLASIGELSLAINAAGARIEVDNLPVRWVPNEPLPVAAGEHVVTALAPGYAPERKRVIVAGRARVPVEMTLAPTASELAHLRITSNVSASDILVGEQWVGRTPLPATIALAPGAHRVSARRPGFTRSERELTLGPGTTGAIEFEQYIDSALPSHLAADLSVEVSEDNARVRVDGLAVSEAGVPTRLPEGGYKLTVERAGFFPYERRIELHAGAPLHLNVTLEPTPEWLDAYRSDAFSRRRAGLITLIAGSAVAAVGGGFLVYNQFAKTSARNNFDDADLNTPGGDCYPARAGKAAASNRYCEEELRIRLDTLEDARSRDLYGWLGLGVGAVAAGTGLILLLTGDDPDRYQHHGADPELRAVPFALPSGGGVMTSGRF